jgi:glucose-fructose oxidoreductase
VTSPPVEEILEELSPFPNGLTPDDDLVPRPGPAPRLRWAVVGLGHFAQSAILPAFAHVKHDHLLTALVTHDPNKGEELRAAYGIERVVEDAAFGALLRSGTIDAVYIALPNHLHAPYTIDAARAGVHVLCERPMAVSRQDCQAMITAAEAHHVRLLIA